VLTLATAVPPQSAKSLEASRAADLAATETATDVDSAQSPAPKPALPSQRSTAQPNTPTRNTAKPSPPYYISRSHSKNLPVYTDFKRGGNLHLTIIRRVQGDLKALKHDMQMLLSKNDDEVKINDLTKQVVIKVWRMSKLPLRISL